MLIQEINDPYKLMSFFGRNLEKISDDDKLALISVLVHWLHDDDPGYTIAHAMVDCGLEVSDRFEKYIAFLADTTPVQALQLIQVLAVQVQARSGK